MSVDGLSDEVVRDILVRTSRIAMVGASARPDRPSNAILRYLLDCGYQVTPINPGLAGTTIHQRVVTAGLAEALPLELVDVFRNSAEAGAVVDEAIVLGARAVWLQLGVIDTAAAARGRAAGVTVVMDRCPAIERPRLGIGR